MLLPEASGANKMEVIAAGGSAPEFFTSTIGAVVVESDIGIGTIVGSAVFNVLFCIGACALVAPEPLHLTWFPLARDASFYAIDLLVVTATFIDEKIKWWEAVILFLLYVCYATFMKYSQAVEVWVLSRGLDEAGVGQDDDKWASPPEPTDGEAPKTLGASAGTGEVQEADLRRIDSSFASSEDVISSSIFTGSLFSIRR